MSRAGPALNEAYRNWSRHRTIRLGAGLAYYGLFALVPLVSLFLSLSDTSNTKIDEAAARIAEELDN